LGAQLAETRKLAAIMAVDVVGYSRLMGEDEAGTALAVREHRDAARPIAAGLGGRIVKTMGDGLLLEFPSVVAAVECAVAIQRLMVERNAAIPEAKRIVYRIGVNLGDVLIEGDDILGDGVNIAARLEGICEPGGALISGSAYEQVRGKIDAEFVDLGEKNLKNISQPLRVYAVKTRSESAAPASSAFESNRPGPPRLSMVVLPFANIGSNQEQEHFVDGVTESLTTDLSQIRGAVVIARNTAFTYKGKPVDVKSVGRELNVRYVLEGSIQRGGNRMRVNVQLIDAGTGNHLWAERFDKPLADLFDMQDEIVSRLANALSAQLVSVEARRAARAPTPDSMDLYFQGLACFHRGFALDTMNQARGHLERALALDAENVDALAWMAMVDGLLATRLSGVERAGRLAAAEVAATRALSLAPGHAWSHFALGFVLTSSNRAEQGIAECERALALDRNLASAHGQIGMSKFLAGRADESESEVRQALRISPQDPWTFVWLTTAGVANAHLGRERDAVDWLRRSIEANRNYPLAHFHLAAALAHLGRLDEARASVAAGLQLQPGFTIAFHRLAQDAVTDNPIYRANRERTLDGLRMAGVPEQ
jgi:TolB-like protein/class 3 adenylate cyclase/Flp pilus assembly protein TadD